MDTSGQQEAWGKIKTLGTITLINGIIDIFAFLILMLFTILMFMINGDVPIDETTGETIPSSVLGALLLVFAVIVLVLAVINIIAGIKLRKPVERPKGWVVCAIILAVVGGGNVLAILQLIFGIFAFSALGSINNQPTKEQIDQG